MSLPVLKKRSTLTFIAVSLFFIITIIVYSCKKDNGSQETSNENINRAKNWYESLYPPANRLKLSAIPNAGETTNGDFSQVVKPDWNKALTYTRFNQQVIELPLDSAVKLGFSNTKLSTDQFNFNKSLSRSSFLIIGNESNYQAYIMTIIADSAYVKGDYSKLDHLSYRNRDQDFSGSVLYFTPKGKLLNGWYYADGKITKSISTANSTNNGLQVQDAGSPKLKTLEMGCTITFNYVYTGTSCVSAYDNTICTNYFDLYIITVCNDSGRQPGLNEEGGGGFPSPGGGGGTTVKPTSQQLTIKTDSLKKHFPCAAKLVIDKLLTDPAYFDFVSKFATAQKPDLVWRDSTLAWNDSNNNYMLGLTRSDISPFSTTATITLNTLMLQNSSQLLIAAAVIHETLHAYINFNIRTASFNQTNGYSDLGTWLYGIDSWATINGLPSNYSNHYEMMEDYFNQAVTILGNWDNHAHSLKQYQMAMLFGLDNAQDGTPAQKVILQTEYNSRLSNNNITTTDIATFYNSQLTATLSLQLPKTGC